MVEITNINNSSAIYKTRLKSKILTPYIKLAVLILGVHF